MQLISKKEKDMTVEEKLKLKFMRTMAVIIYGVNLKDTTQIYNLTWDARVSSYYELFKKVYKVDDKEFLKDPESLKDNFPESQTLYPGKVDFEQALQKSKINPNAILNDTRMRAALLDNMDYSKEDADKLDGIEKSRIKSEAAKEAAIAPKPQIENSGPAPAAQTEDEKIMNGALDEFNQIPDADAEVIPELVDPVDNVLPEDTSSEVEVPEEVIEGEGDSDEAEKDPTEETVDEELEEEVQEEKPKPKTKKKKASKKK